MYREEMEEGGKDGKIRCIGGARSPQGCRRVPCKQPSAEGRAHDFLWRVEKQTPQRGEVVIGRGAPGGDVWRCGARHVTG